jgi:hypothetical protein
MTFEGHGQNRDRAPDVATDAPQNSRLQGSHSALAHATPSKSVFTAANPSPPPTHS